MKMWDIKICIIQLTMLRGKFTAPNSYIRKKEMSQIKDLYSPFRKNKKFEQKINTKHIKKQRHYFANKGPSSEGYGFSSGHVWMWELDCEESWMPKNWWFWTVVLEKTENPLDCKEICPGCSLEGLMLKLKLQYFGHHKWKFDSLKKTLKLGNNEGGEGDRTGWGGWMAPPTQWTWFWESTWSCWKTGKANVLQSMGSQRVGHDWATHLNWTYVPCRSVY